MTKEDLENLMRKHHVWGSTLGGAGNSSVTEETNKFVAKTGGLPNLSFFAELAALANVPIESISCDTKNHGSGCETCGYGGGTSYTVTIPKAQ